MSELPLLNIEDLCVEFRTEEGIVKAVNNLSLKLFAGKTVGIVGESGCGKSVSCMSIPRLIPSPPCFITKGKILLNGIDLLTLSEKQMHSIRGKNIGFIFQEPMTALSPLLKIDFQVAETLLLHSKICKKEALEAAHTWLKKVGIPQSTFSAYPYQLSGGMRQRAMIAMALIMQPELIIADEPTTALDVTIQAQILELMREMRSDKSGLLLITHDMGVIWEMCDEMVVMYASRIVESGPVKEVFSNPLHPYTKGLMNSIPALNTGKGKLPHIPGYVPSLLNLPTGCAFADRCPNCTAACRTTPPPLQNYSQNRQVACLQYS